jgi:hypothetical protein
MVRFEISGVRRRRRVVTTETVTSVYSLTDYNGTTCGLHRKDNSFLCSPQAVPWIVLKFDTVQYYVFQL